MMHVNLPVGAVSVWAPAHSLCIVIEVLHPAGVLLSQTGHPARILSTTVCTGKAPTTAGLGHGGVWWVFVHIRLWVRV